MLEKTLLATGALALILFTATRSTAATPTIEWSAAGYTTSENAGSIAVRVVRTGDLSGTSSIGFDTMASSAIPGVHYVATNGTLMFAPGESNKTLNITLLDNALVEPNTFPFPRF